MPIFTPQFFPICLQLRAIFTSSRRSLSYAHELPLLILKHTSNELTCPTAAEPEMPLIYFTFYMLFLQRTLKMWRRHKQAMSVLGCTLNTSLMKRVLAGACATHARYAAARAEEGHFSHVDSTPDQRAHPVRMV